MLTDSLAVVVVKLSRIDWPADVNDATTEAPSTAMVPPLTCWLSTIVNEPVLENGLIVIWYVPVAGSTGRSKCGLSTVADVKTDPSGAYTTTNGSNAKLNA